MGCYVGVCRALALEDVLQAKRHILAISLEQKVMAKLVVPWMALRPIL